MNPLTLTLRYIIENMARHLVATCIFLIAFGLFGAAAGAGADAEPRPTLTFGVVPQQSASELARLWTPILSFLGEKTGEPLRFATAKDLSTFEQRLAAGDYDLAYLNPYAYTMFHRSPGYRVLAKEKDRMLQGILVVRKSDDVPEVGRLHGKTIAFPDPAAFAASILVQAELGKKGVAVVPKYVANHDSVYFAVARGLVAAGGGIPRTFDNLAPEIRDQLRVLWRTAAYTPHAIAAHPRLADATAARLQAAMAAMADDPRGAELLAAAGFKRLSVARDADYDDIRRLDIRPRDLAIAREQK